MTDATLMLRISLTLALSRLAGEGANVKDIQP
jgi:hypothetical protein